MVKSRKIRAKNTKKSRRSRPRKHRGGGDEEVLAYILARIKDSDAQYSAKKDRWISSNEYKKPKAELIRKKEAGIINEQTFYGEDDKLYHGFYRANPKVEVVGTLTPDERRVYTDYLKKQGHAWQLL